MKYQKPKTEPSVEYPLLAHELRRMLWALDPQPTRAEIVEGTGISLEHVRLLMYGERGAREDKLKKLAEFFGGDPEVLITACQKDRVKRQMSKLSGKAAKELTAPAKPAADELSDWDNLTPVQQRSLLMQMEAFVSVNKAASRSNERVSGRKAVRGTVPVAKKRASSGVKVVV